MANAPKTTTARPKAAPKDKRAQFLKIAPKRMSNALRAIGLIGNCASRAGYEYTGDDVAKMENALLQTVNDTMARFKSANVEKPKGFSF